MDILKLWFRFGHRIINTDPGGQTLLNFQGRHNASTWTDIMTLTSNGNVGIGTTSPDVDFHIANNGNVLELGDSTNSSTWMSIEGTRASVGYNANGLVLQGGVGKHIRFQVNSSTFGGGTEALRIDNTGNIGIGTSSPGAKLEVVGSANNASIILSNENLIGFKRTDGALVYGIGHTAGEFTIGRTANLGPTAGTPINIATGAYQIRFSQGTQERMRIATSGNVGIGTASPDEKLTVKGTIHSEEVKVDLSVP